ncbi:uncharacterized protein LOC115041717 [Echeneis naucrates]|uniref:Uncharacterized LOC115041717 n=1 Tax=Echeneis naucrates TaxID=173247 RepID=A0A665USP2_ECHNA|nr:uncharacterized protein LOC115041717 [Echeneis naucrates]
MARNEEKQQGRLNRLWLQKERDEGRLRDVHERRPKLSSLNSASSVKRWIPSIKNEIEYYLQQSQLSHYPERKIAEFQLHIDSLEKEYKSFIAKLRVLDPSCKHKPWTPRAYSKRTAETQSTVKKPRQSEDSSLRSGPERDTTSSWSGCQKTLATERQGPLSYSDTRFQTFVPTNPMLQTSEAVCADQDQPLSFDQTRLAVATAAFRGESAQLRSSQTQSLARVLQGGLPNLSNSASDNNGRTRLRLAVGREGAVHECVPCGRSWKSTELCPASKSYSMLVIPACPGKDEESWEESGLHGSLTLSVPGRAAPVPACVCSPRVRSLPGLQHADGAEADERGSTCDRV